MSVQKKYKSQLVFGNFSKLSLNNLYEVIECFTCYNFTNKKNIIISENAYQSEYLRERDSSDFYATKESLFSKLLQTDTSMK